MLNKIIRYAKAETINLMEEREFVKIEDKNINKLLKKLVNCKTGQRLIEILQLAHNTMDFLSQSKITGNLLKRMQIYTLQEAIQVLYKNQNNYIMPFTRFDHLQSSLSQRQTAKKE